MSMEASSPPDRVTASRRSRGGSSTLGWLWRCLPGSWRFGKSFPEFQELARAGEEWTVEEIHAYQAKHLRATLIHAANFCPYYQRTFARAGLRPELVRGPEDLRDCPWLEREELRQHLPELVSTAFPRKARVPIRTGETGEFLLHKGISQPKEHVFLERMWARVGYQEGARVAVLGGDDSGSPGRTGEVVYDARRGRMLIAETAFGSERWPAGLEAMEEFGPDFLQATPGVALRVAGSLDGHGQSWRGALRAVLCGPGGLSREEKRLLERVFGCRVYRWYGQSEQAVLAGEGASSELLYFFPQYGLVEFGPATREGWHEVIATSFHNLVLPLVRYRTRQYVRLADPRRDGDLEFPWPAVEFPSECGV